MQINDTILTVIDVQGNLAALMYDHERLFANIERMIRICRIMEVPIVWTEQAPDKIGATIEPIAALLKADHKPIPKRSFSCYGCPEFKNLVDQSGRRNILITGIETHVCVYQTVRDMKRQGYNIHLLADSVSSRTQANKEIAIERMRDEGVIITSAEMAVTELLGGADHPKFREAMANIKR